MISARRACQLIQIIPKSSQQPAVRCLSVSRLQAPFLCRPVSVNQRPASIIKPLSLGRSLLSTMPPVDTKNYKDRINELIQKNAVVVFSKSTCPYCNRVKHLFNEMNVPATIVELDQESDGEALHSALKSLVDRTSVPQVFVNGRHVGGCDDTIKAKDSGDLANWLRKQSDYDYDLIIIGGGSGGLAAAGQASKYGKKVAILDYVDPSPIGTSWGLGGTCVNVGCIPKKLMHQAGLIGQTLKDSSNFGWQISYPVEHSWEKMRQNIQDHIKGLNFGYRVSMRQKKIDYVNARASFVDGHKIRTVDKKGEEKFLTSERFILATGERPRYPDIPGAKELAITSDDLFSLDYCPGKTLVVGASYVALECAGFLKGIGLDVSVMVRSILLRGFDQEMAEKVGSYMKEEGVKFIRPCVPTKIEKIEDGKPGKLRVVGKMVDSGEEVTEECNTVLFAIGRDPCTNNLGLDAAGVHINPKNGKIPTVNEQTNIEHIYAVGDILDGKPELTPVAIQAGLLLTKRLYGGQQKQCDYVNVPTTVFTPLEYGCCGLTEEQAEQQFGKDNLEVFISNIAPLEWKLPHRQDNACFAKLICVINQQMRVVGFHYLGPNAGEVTQLAGLPLKMGATKQDFDNLIGIHPTCAEVFTTLTVTKRSGESPEQKGC